MGNKQPDLFIREQRDTLDLMSVPVVSLSSKKRTEPIRYKRGDTDIEVSAPDHIGLATIYDWDIIQFCVGRITEALNDNVETSQTITTPVYDLLRSIHRHTSGTDYRRFREALDRLKATTIRTNIRSSQKTRYAAFGLIDNYLWEETADGTTRGVSITLSRWLYDAIKDRRVLGIDQRYYEMTGGLEKWLYRLCRKQAGDQRTGWRWSISELYERSGSVQPVRNFAVSLRSIVAENQLPEYALTIYTDQTGSEALHAVRRSKLEITSKDYETPIPRNKRNPKS